MHDTGKVFFSLFCWRVVPKQQKHISVRKNFLRSQRYGECFTLIEEFRNSDDRTQNTEAWCLYFSKFCAKKTPGWWDKKEHKTRGRRQYFMQIPQILQPQTSKRLRYQSSGLGETGAHGGFGHGVQGILTNTHNVDTTKILVVRSCLRLH